MIYLKDIWSFVNTIQLAVIVGKPQASMKTIICREKEYNQKDDQEYNFLCES